MSAHLLRSRYQGMINSTSLERLRINTGVLTFTYKALSDHHIYLEETFLKPNMVTAGQFCPKQYISDENGRTTVNALSHTKPATVTTGHVTFDIASYVIPSSQLKSIRVALSSIPIQEFHSMSGIILHTMYTWRPE